MLIPSLILAHSRRTFKVLPLRHTTRFLSIRSSDASSPLSLPRVLVLTDGGIEASLKATALGRQLVKHNLARLETKTWVASKALEMFPPILQKYFINWAFSPQKDKGDEDQSLPWYLRPIDKDNKISKDIPDYVVCSGVSAVPACLYMAKLDPKKVFSVYLGHPAIPFISFDQVVLPKYEANAKMAALGPLARQKNCIITESSLLDPYPLCDENSLAEIIPDTFLSQKDSSDITAVVVGGYSFACRWYSEDAVTLGDNIKRMVNSLNTKLVIVFTERTTPMVKSAIMKSIDSFGDKSDSVAVWDVMSLSSEGTDNTLRKVQQYESLISKAKRVVLTADLDYLTAHAASRRKPVYIAFGGQCRSYLLQFHQWAREVHLTRKLRLDRTKHTKISGDPFSYLGHHARFADGLKLLKVQPIMADVLHEIEAVRAEKVTGKRRKN
ncbi:mitochondrial fission ELM1-domain-containing protein [Phycomyces blakesleeanus]